MSSHDYRLIDTIGEVQLGSLEWICLVLNHCATAVSLFCLVSFRQILNCFIVPILDLIQVFVWWALASSARYNREKV